MDLAFLNKAKITDVHTHNVNAVANAIYNILPSEFLNFQFKARHFYSAGIHPWYISDIDLQFAQLQTLLQTQSNIVLIGECGLDKLNGPDIQIQMGVFKKHLALAVAFQKPVIIHCVKAYQEILDLIKKENFTLPFIFHGFNKSVALAQQIIAAGGCISLGLKIQKDTEQLGKYLQALPKEKIFFESD